MPLKLLSHLHSLSKTASLEKSNVALDSAKSDQITVVFAQWIAPCADDSDDPHLIEQGAIAIQKNTIIAIGTATDVQATVSATNQRVHEIHLPKNSLIIPGLINAHTHLPMNLLKGYKDDVDLMTWLTQYIWPAEQAMIADDFVYHGTLLACYEAIVSGTTMINDSYFLPDASVRAIELAGIRGIHSDVILDLGKNDIDQQMQRASERVYKHYENPEYAKSRAQTSLNPHSCYMVPQPWLEKLAKIQQDINSKNPQIPLLCHIHVHETLKERQIYEEKNGKTAIQSLDEAGLLSKHLVAAHCAHMTPEEIQLFAQRQVNVCHCMKSNLKLASGIAPVCEMLQAGINVCIGTDSACSNNSIDMLSEMQTVCLVHKGHTKNPLAMNAYSVLKMATRNGAKALGRFNELGSLEINKLADFVAIDLAGRDQTNIPIYDPIAHLLYTNQCQVTDSWVDGKHILQNGTVESFQPDFEAISRIISKLKELRSTLINQSMETSTKQEVTDKVADSCAETAATTCEELEHPVA